MARDYSTLFDEEPTTNKYADLFAEEEKELDPQSTEEFAAGAAMDFAESMLGVGDEAGAIGIGLGGSLYDLLNTDKSLKEIAEDNFDWERNISQARQTLDTFEAQNPKLSGAITAAGIGGSLLIPGAGAVKLAQVGGKLNRAAKTGALVAAEGAAYGALSGRGEEGRMEGAIVGAMLGGTLGLGTSMLLRNSDEIARMAQEDQILREQPDVGHIAGKGWAEAGDNRAQRDVSKASSDSSTQDRKVQRVLTDAQWEASGGDRAGSALEEITKKMTGQAGNWLGDMRRWIVANVGERAAKLTEDAEWMGRSARAEWVGKIEDKLKGFDDAVEGNQLLAAALNNLGRKGGGTWDDVFEAGGPEMAEQLTVFKNMYDDLKALDVPDLLTDDWIHTAVKPALPGQKRGRVGPEGLEYKVSDYQGPAKAMIEYADEITSANALAERFGISMADVKIGKGNKARIEGVISAVRAAAKEEGASKAVLNNLEDALRSTFIASKAGGDAAGSIARKWASTAYLGSPMNAILNVSEWVTPAFQNNVANWAQQIPAMVGYAMKDTYNTWFQLGKYGLPKIEQKGLTPEAMGLGDQFMGEVAAEGAKTFGRWTDTLSKFIYDKSLVSTSNRTGQFSQMNSAVNRGSALAKKALAGDQKAMDKFRQLDGTRGLSETELRQTAEALANRDLESAWTRNFAGASLNMWQPVSATALPKAFADNPNMRMFYSMLTYMNRQMNAAREQIGGNMMEAHRRGLNTAEGRAAARKGAMAAARYTAYYGVGAGVWERYRSSLDESRDIDMDEVLTPEGMTEAAVTQVVSNLTSGLVDLRGREYGRGQFNVVPAPVTFASDVGSGLVSGAEGMLTGDDAQMREFYRMLQGNVPGISAADKMNRLFNEGERLFVQPQD